MSPKEALLYRITELMFEKQQTFLLLDELYEDEVISSFIRNIQIDSPYQQLLFDGVLSQYNHQNEIVVSFTIEAYFHHFLGLILNKNKEIETPKTLSELIEKNKLTGFNKGVAKYLANHIENKNYNLLFDYIDYPGIPLDICVPALVQMMFVKGEVFTLDLMLQNPTIKDWETIDLTLKALVHANQFNLVEKVVKYIILLNNDILIQNRSFFDVGLMFYNAEILAEILNKALNEKQENRNLICKCYYITGNFNEIIQIIENEGYDQFEFIDLLNYSGALIDTCQAQKAVDFIKENLLVLDGLNEIDKFKTSKMLAISLHGVGQYNDALQEISKTIDASFKHLGKFNMFNCELLNTAGLLSLSQGMFDEAEEMFSLAYKNCLAIVGEYHHETGIAINNMSLIYYYQNDFKKAIEIFSKSLDIYEQCFGENHPETARVHLNLANCYKKIGDWQSSINQYSIGAEIFKNSNGINDPNFQKVILDLKKIYNDNPNDQLYTSWILELLKKNE